MQAKTSRAWLHGGEGGGGAGATCNLLLYLDHVYIIGGVTRPGGLPCLSGRVFPSAGLTI